MDNRRDAIKKIMIGSALVAGAAATSKGQEEPLIGTGNHLGVPVLSTTLASHSVSGNTTTERIVYQGNNGYYETHDMTYTRSGNSVSITDTVRLYHSNDFNVPPVSTWTFSKTATGTPDGQGNMAIQSQLTFNGYQRPARNSFWKNPQNPYGTGSAQAITEAIAVKKRVQ